MSTDDRLRTLQRTIPAALVESATWLEPMASLTSIGTGGPATAVLRCTSPTNVALALRWATEVRSPIQTLGHCTNVLVHDGGIDGIVVVQTGDGIDPLAETGATLTARVDAGCSWDDLVRWSLEQGCGGIEAMSGIPGTVGAAPVQNIGAYGQNVDSIIDAVDVLDRRTGEATTLLGEACGLAYRTSVFKRSPDRYVLTAVTVRMARAETGTARHPAVSAWLAAHGHDPTETSLSNIREAVLAVRGARSMLLRPAVDPQSRGVGSFFMNPTVTAEVADRVGAVATKLGAEVRLTRSPSGTAVVSAADLLAASGFACGHIDGEVGISSSYPSALVNRGGATTSDVLRLARRIQRGVLDRFGISLEPEPRIIGRAAPQQ